MSGYNRPSSMPVGVSEVPRAALWNKGRLIKLDSLPPEIGYRRKIRKAGSQGTYIYNYIGWTVGYAWEIIYFIYYIKWRNVTVSYEMQKVYLYLIHLPVPVRTGKFTTEDKDYSWCDSCLRWR